MNSMNSEHAMDIVVDVLGDRMVTSAMVSMRALEPIIMGKQAGYTTDQIVDAALRHWTRIPRSEQEQWIAASVAVKKAPNLANRSSQNSSNGSGTTPTQAPTPKRGPGRPRTKTEKPAIAAPADPFADIENGQVKAE